MSDTPLAIINPAGKVVTFVRPDVPEGWAPPDGCSAVPENELPSGWEWETPKIETRVEVLSPKEFLDRFTMAELMAISTRARTDALLDVMFRKLTSAESVHTNSEELLQGLDYLVSLKLLTPERKRALLGSPPEPVSLWAKLANLFS